MSNQVWVLRICNTNSAVLGSKFISFALKSEAQNYLLSTIQHVFFDHLNICKFNLIPLIDNLKKYIKNIEKKNTRND